MVVMSALSTDVGFCCRRSGGKLEGIVGVRAPSASAGPQRGDEIGGDEQRAPSFVLANMDELVHENGIIDPIDAQDDVAERDRPVAPPEPPRP